MERYRGRQSQSLPEDIIVGDVTGKAEILGSCTDFEKITWTELYDSRYSPPPGWKNNITLIIDGRAEDDSENFVWWSFAEYYSKSYYRYAGYYGSPDPQNALYSAAQILGDERFYLMKEFFKMQAEEHNRKVVKAEWREKTPRSTIMIWRPVYVVEFDFSDMAKLQTKEFDMTLFDVQITHNRNGISFAAIIVKDFKHEVKVTTGGISINFRTSDYVDGYDRMYISHPATYKFHGTGVYLKYSVRKEYVGNCPYPYWVITPLPIPFTPKYIKLWDDLKYSRGADLIKSGDPMPADYSKIAWEIIMGKAELRLFKEIRGQDLQKGRMLVDELQQDIPGIHEDAGAAFENIFYDLSIGVVSTTIGTLVNPLAGFFVGLLTLLDFVDFTVTTSC